MDALAFAGLLSALAALLSLLSWIGWRFFIAPMPTAEAPTTPQEPAGPKLLTPWWSSIARFRAPRFLRRTLIAILLIGGGTVGAVLSLSELIAPDPLSAQDMERQAHIQSALNPERLVPPPALPPTLFVSTERPALESADRDWNKLNPRFTQSVLLVLARLRERGYEFALLEGYRSPERQEKLANLGNHVTNARAFQSKHQYGFAVDLAPLRDNRLVISERDPWAMQAYTALGEETQKIGLTWGGRWWFKDYGHIEAPESVSALAQRTNQ